MITIDEAMQILCAPIQASGVDPEVFIRATINRALHVRNEDAEEGRAAMFILGVREGCNDRFRSAVRRELTRPQKPPPPEPKWQTIGPGSHYHLPSASCLTFRAADDDEGIHLTAYPLTGRGGHEFRIYPVEGTRVIVEERIDGGDSHDHS